MLRSFLFRTAVHVFFSSPQSLSDCENDLAKRAALNEVTQSTNRVGQREGLRHDRFDRAGSKQRDNKIPGVRPSPLRVDEKVETPGGGLWDDESGHVNGCLSARGIPQR